MHFGVGTVPIQVLITVEGSNYLLCTLDKNKTWQMPLDLNFMEGTEISFSCNGQGNVHLTGYLTLEDDTDGLEEEEFDEEDDEEEDEDEVQTTASIEKNKKRKPLDMPKGAKDEKRMKSKATLSKDDEDDLDFPSQDEDSDMDDDSTLDEDNDDDEDEEDEESDHKDNNLKSKNHKTMALDKKQKGQNKEKMSDVTKSQPQLVNGTTTKHEQQSKKQNKQKEQKEQKKKVEGGVQIEDLKVGNGDVAKPGKFVSVYYVGRLKNGKKFDSNNQGGGLKFKLGRGEVIKGWDVGLAGMKVGGKRRLTIPPAMGYVSK